MTKAGTTVEPELVTLTTSGDWTPSVAQSIASVYGIELGMEHWAVIAACREEVLRCGEHPSLRRLARLSGVSESRLVDMFVVDPCRIIRRIAGLQTETGRTSPAASFTSKGAAQ